MTIDMIKSCEYKILVVKINKRIKLKNKQIKSFYNFNND